MYYNHLRKVYYICFSLTNCIRNLVAVNVDLCNLNKDTIKCSFDATYFFSEYLKQPSTFYDLFIIYYNRIIYLKRITIKLSFYDLTKKVKYNNCVYPTFNLQDLTYMSIEVMVSQTTFILSVPCIGFNC